MTRRLGLLHEVALSAAASVLQEHSFSPVSPLLFFFSLSISCVSLFFIQIKFLMTHFILSNCVIILFSSLFFSHKCNVTLS